MNSVLKKCPNCGANIEHNYNHKCPYCRTALHVTNEQIKTINNCDIKIDRVEIERNPIANGFLVTVRGWSTPKFHYLEELNDNNFVVSGNDVGVPIGYRMEIPAEILYDNFIKLPEYIYSCIPPQLCNGYNEDKIVSECLDFFLNRSGKRLNI